MNGLARIVAAALGLALGAAGCFAMPTPLAPALGGSVGVPHRGVLTDGAALSRVGPGHRLYRKNDVHYGNPRLVRAIERAAAEVARQRPGGAKLVVGDLAARDGGATPGHRSHRTGRDADLLFYALTPGGRSVPAPGFARFGPDGLADTGDGKTFVRLDVEREWLLVKALLQDPEANVQWLFCARWLEAQIVEYALARGEDLELVWHAQTVLLQPGDSSAHDDHLHYRTACTPEEAVAGCLGGGPYWDWNPPLPQLVTPSDDELVAALVGDLDAAVGRGGAP